MRTAIAAILAGTALTGFAHADPMEDALVIVDNTIDANQYAKAFEGLGDLMLGTLQNELSKEGKKISRSAGQVYVKMLTSHMTDALVDQMREPLAEAYVANVSPETLAAYRAFLETEEGQEIVLTRSIILDESLKIGEDIAGVVAAPAVAAAQADMESGNWPEGTLKTTQSELRDLFLLPEVSDEPPER